MGATNSLPMTALDRIASIDDLRQLACRRIPKFAFDFIDGGAEDERNLRENRRAFHDIEITPRYLVDASSPKTEITLWESTYSAPIGIAPMGFFNMAWPGADLMAARLAANARIPYVISAASSTRLEDLTHVADGMAWFQIYISADTALTESLITRAEAAGCKVLIVTVDVAQPGKRDRDIRNGLQMPFRVSPKIALDLALHPSWSLGTLRSGAPGFANFQALGADCTASPTMAEVQRSFISNTIAWSDLKQLRDRWKGKLVVKGLMHPQDAQKAVELGVDAVQVSNHGGRQADFAPAAIAALSPIAEAIGAKAKIFVDGGIRRGSDVAKAKALGTDFAFAGRPFAYGASAGGMAGMRKTHEILQLELSRTLGQMGCPKFENVDATVLTRPGEL